MRACQHVTPKERATEDGIGSIFEHAGQVVRNNKPGSCQIGQSAKFFDPTKETSIVIACSVRRPNHAGIENPTGPHHPRVGKELHGRIPVPGERQLEVCAQHMDSQARLPLEKAAENPYLPAKVSQSIGRNQ
jgi:hypothetical protein